jgi:alpha-beta hydrolase superfamily lysophospholipase
MLLLMHACAAPSGPGEILLTPGEAGDYGAAWVSTHATARITESLAVEVTFPADADGMPDPDALPGEAVVLVQGGLVAVARYRWLSGWLAAQGYVVIAPDHPGDLAIFAAENGRYALEAVEAGSEAGSGVLDGLVTPGGPAAVAGHSLGGVVSAILWAEDTRLDSLVLMASYPADSTDVAARSAPVLSLTGALDAQALEEQVEAGWTRFSQPSWMGVVEGMGHYGWTTGDSPDDLAAGGDTADGVRDDALVQADTMAPMLAFLAASLRDDAGAEAALEAGDFSGVTWSP